MLGFLRHHQPTVLYKKMEPGSFLMHIQPLNESSLSPSDMRTIYIERRQQVLEILRNTCKGALAIIPTAPERTRSRDTDHPYRHDSYFYYLTGFTEPEAMLVLDASAEKEAPSSILFCRPKNEEREIWDGFRFGPHAARDALGVDEAHSIETLDQEMPVLLAKAPAICYAFGQSHTLDKNMRRWLAAAAQKNRTGRRAPSVVYDITALLDPMRAIKHPHEIDLMRRAARISAQGHLRAMEKCYPGIREYELEAELLYTFRRHGSQSTAYSSIVAAGPNACVLHHLAGTAEARVGDMVLIDAACELDSYAADITRTFPVNGRFSKPQRTLYEIVLAAQQAAIDATQPGASFNEPHEAALRILTQGLLDTGLLPSDKYGSLEDAIEKEAYKRFYMHKTSHWLGLDVHDCGLYRDLQAPRGKDNQHPWIRLQKNMVLTIEPGLYVRAAADIPEEYWDIGIRIEDDAVVTEKGCELLSRDVPVTVAEIEALVGCHKNY